MAGRFESNAEQSQRRRIACGFLFLGFSGWVHVHDIWIEPNINRTVLQIQNPKFLQDIGDLLSTGEISNLFSAEEKLAIIDKMSAIDKQRDKTLQTTGTPTALYNFYLTVHNYVQFRTIITSDCRDEYSINIFRLFESSCTLLCAWHPLETLFAITFVNFRQY